MKGPLLRRSFVRYHVHVLSTPRIQFSNDNYQQRIYQYVRIYLRVYSYSNTNVVMSRYLLLISQDKNVFPFLLILHTYHVWGCCVEDLLMEKEERNLGEGKGYLSSVSNFFCHSQNKPRWVGLVWPRNGLCDWLYGGRSQGAPGHCRRGHLHLGSGPLQVQSRHQNQPSVTEEGHVSCWG